MYGVFELSNFSLTHHSGTVLRTYIVNARMPSTPLSCFLLLFLFLFLFPFFISNSNSTPPGLHPPFTVPNARSAAVVAGIALILSPAGVEGVPVLFFQ